jgi:asparagine synthase (glutamine-hydrolysing)
VCGILGVVNLDGAPVDSCLLSRMRDVMIHRGPDDGGLFVDANVGLSSRRLAIVDLSKAGHQPMPNEDETLWLVFNGEIYNFVELAEELSQKGHHFRSSTDCEVLLHLYEELGPNCLSRLNGMFAFAIWDSRRRRLFAARDRLGIKPFHFFHDSQRFIFASEVKAILEDPTIPRVPDERAIADYFFCGFPQEGKTFFRGIQTLLPGEALCIEQGQRRTWVYWRPQYQHDTTRSESRLVEEVGALIDDAVRIHCRSDAALGCHLSGGLDSSTVACLAARHRGQIHSFSVRFHDYPIDETPLARVVSRHAGTRYHDITASWRDLGRLLPSLVWHMDMPLHDPGGFSYYMVSKLASDFVKVSLTGHGGDEVFGGYPAQYELAFGSSAVQNSMTRLADPTIPISYRIRRAIARDGILGTFRRLLSRLGTPDSPTPEERWTRLHCGREPERLPEISRGFVAQLNGYSPRASYVASFREAATDELFERALHHDLRSYLPGLLHIEDRVSMAHSLESRVPLLDYRIVEFLASVPVHQKASPDSPKKLLRAAATRWLPPEITERALKANFTWPFTDWISKPLGPNVRALLTSRFAGTRTIFTDGALSSPAFLRTFGWQAVNLELWHRIFIDRNLSPSESLESIE